MLYLKGAELINCELPANIIEIIKKRGEFTANFPKRKFPKNQIVYKHIGTNIFKPNSCTDPVIQLVGQKFVDMTTKEDK